MRTTLFTSTNLDGTGIVRDPTETMYPPNISLGFGVPRKTKSRRLNNLMYLKKFSCISARSRVHFVDNSLNESIDYPRCALIPQASSGTRRIMAYLCATRWSGHHENGWLSIEEVSGVLLGVLGYNGMLLVLVVKGGCLARIYHRLCCVVVDGARRSPLRPCDRGPRA